MEHNAYARRSLIKAAAACGAALVATAARYEGPALIMHGLNDTVVLPEYSERLHEAIQNSSLYLIARAGHTPVTLIDEVVCLADLFYQRCMRQ